MKKQLFSMAALILGFTSGFAGEDKQPSVALSSSVEDVSGQTMEDQIKKYRTIIAQVARDNKDVLQEFDRLSVHVKEAVEKERSLTQADGAKILNALQFAADKHRLQTRKNAEKTPYIVHPIEVAVNLMKIGGVRDPSLIIAALLHDTLEDTQTTFGEIEKAFGKDVATYVKELTNDKNLAQPERKRQQIITASRQSFGAAQIKLADKLCNLRELTNTPPKDWSQERIDRYYEWAQTVVDRLPAANPALKKAVDELVDHYWDGQGSKKSKS